MLYLLLSPFPWLGVPELVKEVRGGSPLAFVYSGLFEPLLEFSPPHQPRGISAETFCHERSSYGLLDNAVTNWRAINVFLKRHSKTLALVETAAVVHVELSGPEYWLKSFKGITLDRDCMLGKFTSKLLPAPAPCLSSFCARELAIRTQKSTN